LNNELDALVPLGRRGLIQATNLIITIVIACLAAMKMIILGAYSLPIPAVVLVTVGLATALYIRRHGSIDIAAWILVINALFGFTFSSIYTGGFNASVVLFAPIVPIMTVLLINKRAAYISLGLVCLILAGVFIYDFIGYVPEDTRSPNLVLLADYVVLTCLCLVLTWVVSRYSSISQTLMIKLEKQSNIDYLTGILNRRGIETRLLLEVGRAKRSDTWLSFIMADVDFFKLYNDKNGHQAGDNCLKDIAELIANCCERPSDVVGRFGGEEFVLILPDTDIDGARNVAENIRKKILDQNIPYGPQNAQPVTLTLGIVSAHGHIIDEGETLIRYADAALYEGKAKGRNCVVSKVFNRPQVKP
jgi:diguanylate cyclase (GGDEF)-like protein